MKAYKTVQFNPELQEGKSKGAEKVAKGLQDLINQEIKTGWEFVGVDTVWVQVNPGCLSIFTGGKPVQVPYGVVTFCRDQ